MKNLPDGKYLTSPHLVPTIEREIVIHDGNITIVGLHGKPRGKYIYSQSDFFDVNKLIRSL